MALTGAAEQVEPEDQIKEWAPSLGLSANKSVQVDLPSLAGQLILNLRSGLQV